MRAALAPDLAVERELARGGTGVVFAARDLALDRAVVVKVLRPELASAAAAERFVREGQFTARLAHPSIVPVFRAGEADGLFYLVMGRLEGETLAGRLTRGPLPRAALEALAADLLDALAAAHAAGVVHRDVKPGNIFVVDGRTVVTDFGIARAIDARVTTPGEGGGPVGTPAYLTPEQIVGAAATPATDQHAAAQVLFEAATGRRWHEAPLAWDGVPSPWRRALRRALAADPADRFASVADFRRALVGARRRRLALAAAGLVLIAAATGLAVAGGDRGDDTPPPRLTVAAAVSDEGAGRGLADSVGNGVVSRLSGHTDFAARAAERAPPGGLLLAVALGRRGDSLVASADLRSAAGSSRAAWESARPAGDWRLLADDLANAVLVALWQPGSPDPWLPVRALPRSPGARARWLQAEQFLAEARWGEAYAAFLAAVRADSSCLLCEYRLLSLDRWLMRDPDEARMARLAREAAAFPPPYQVLLRAAALPPAARRLVLDSATARYREFPDAWMQLGDEILHRGPLAGIPRAAAVAPLRHAVRLRPDLAGAWEHLAWALIAEADSAEAAEALASLARTHPPRDGYTSGLRGLLTIGFAYRFLPGPHAEAVLDSVLSAPGVLDLPETAAGPRVMASFGTPAAAVAMGERFSRRAGDPDLARAGTVARALGWAGRGRMDLALELARTLRDGAVEPAAALESLALEAVCCLAGAAPAPPELLSDLREAAHGTWAAPIRDRAAALHWLLAGETAPPPSLAGEPGRVLRAEHAARQGAVSRAAALADAVDVFELARAPDPHWVAWLHLRRAEWHAAQGDAAGAAAILRWHEHQSLRGAPAGPVQHAEVDWALAGLAAWRQAAVLEGRARERTALCRALAETVRLWADGDALHRGRADSARQRHAELRCPAR